MNLHPRDAAAAHACMVLGRLLKNGTYETDQDVSRHEVSQGHGWQELHETQPLRAWRSRMLSRRGNKDVENLKETSLRNATTMDDHRNVRYTVITYGLGDGVLREKA